MKKKLNGDSRIIDKIVPKDFPVGCRRPTPGEGFLEALVAKNTEVFTDQIRAVTEKGFIDDQGKERVVDAIICATGFDTSWIPRFPIRAHGKDLRDIWSKSGALSYLAVAVPEFPNYFCFAGPVSALVYSCSTELTWTM
jgi:cation diffusion facilitator CzcD-associated flavoprotein CzcO